MNMPLDVICVIFNLLGTDDSMAFALACKGLSYHFFADSRRIFNAASQADKHKVQTMLEKDLSPSDIYCPFCRKFHDLDDEHYRSNICLEKNEISSSSFFTVLPGGKSLHLTYLDARRAVNAVLFNRPFAKATLDLLKRNCTQAGPSSYWTQRWTPKVVGGELLLKIDSRHVGQKGEKFTFNMCKHVDIRGDFPGVWVQAAQLQRLVRVFSRTPGDGESAALATCDACLAEWKLKIEWEDDEETLESCAWYIDISSWHRFGNVRSPYNTWEWACSAGEERNAVGTWTVVDSVCLTKPAAWYYRTYDLSFDGEPIICGSTQRMWESTEEDAK